MDPSQSMSTDFGMVIGESDVGNTEKSKGACVKFLKEDQNMNPEWLQKVG